MKTISYFFVFNLVFGLLPGSVLGKNHGFPYKFLLGATGSNIQIKELDAWIDIRFSESSNKKCLQALRGLKWEVLNRNSDGSKIFLIGQKLDSYQFDIDGKTRIYDFVLNGWYIFCPFEIYIKPKGWMPGDKFEIGEKQSLDGTCFQETIDIDYGKYCKTNNGS